MNSTGGEMIDTVIPDVRICVDAMKKNDVKTLKRKLSENEKFMEKITPHITHHEVRKVAAEQADAFKSLVACMNQGKCGARAYLLYLGTCIIPLTTLFTSLID